MSKNVLCKVKKKNQAVLTGTVHTGSRVSLVQRDGSFILQAGTCPRSGGAESPLSSVIRWLRDILSLVGQPVIPMFTKVEGIDDAQSSVGGSQLSKHTHTHA